VSAAIPSDAWLRDAACVDLRTAAAHAEARPAGSVRLDVDDLLYRPYLLPPRARPLVLVGGPAASMRLVVKALAAAGHADVRHLPDETWRELLTVEVGVPSRTHLWEPAAALVEALRDHAPSGRTALDLACGSGRNAVYLALQGYDVTAYDILPDAVAKANDLAWRSGTSIRAVQRDLAFAGALDDDSADVVAVVRYLDRALFPALQRAVRPGGILVYETFTVEQAAIGHPRNPRFLLESEELAHAFPALETVVYREGFFDGAYLAHLIACRPGDVR
jgi:SAM-dependent methyltransferase